MFKNKKYYCYNSMGKAFHSHLGRISRNVTLTLMRISVLSVINIGPKRFRNLIYLFKFYSTTIVISVFY